MDRYKTMLLQNPGMIIEHLAQCCEGRRERYEKELKKAQNEERAKFIKGLIVCEDACREWLLEQRMKV